MASSITGLLESRPILSSSSSNSKSKAANLTPIEEIWIPHCTAFARRVALIEDEDARDNIMRGMDDLYYANKKKKN